MITLDTITRYAGANGVLLNAQQTGLESAGFIHRLKSFFGIGDAREKNRATLNALKDAVLTDPRFNTPDLQAQVERLFKNEHTFLAVDMSRIKGIMNKMVRLADGSDAMLDRRVDLHLAAILPPPGVNSPIAKAMLVRYANLDDIALIAKQHVRNAACAPGANGVVDVAKLVGEVLDRSVLAITSTTPLNRRHPIHLMKFVGQQLQHFLMGPDRTLRTSGEVVDYVRNAFEFYRKARDVAMREMESPLLATLAEQEAAARSVEPRAKAALEFACTVGEKVDLEMFDRIHDYVANLPLDAFRNLSPKSTDADFSMAIGSLAEHMASHPFRGADGRCPFDNLKATKSLARYLANLVALRLPEPLRVAICNRLDYPTAAKAMENAIHDAILHGNYIPLHEEDE